MFYHPKLDEPRFFNEAITPHILHPALPYHLLHDGAPGLGPAMTWITEAKEDMKDAVAQQWQTYKREKHSNI